ncbi:MAG TPA: DUF2277 domain-containing protein [Frankiaceae bacterium]|nr:DUF2277 domain-containing protein [Frankiaceae bacterium]
MCRSIKTLRGAEPPPTESEVAAAALQYVRKLSGYRAPSKRNTEAFERAVAEVAAASERLLAALGSPPVPGPPPPRPVPPSSRTRAPRPVGAAAPPA